MNEDQLFVRLALFLLLTVSRMNQNVSINAEHFMILKDTVVVHLKYYHDIRLWNS
jgi:hypothetical protein